jgi:hypothetical protein
MQTTPSLSEEHCEIPADCYNRLCRLRVQSGGCLVFGLPGLAGNYMVLRGHHWQLCNRQLDTLLLSWEDFRNGCRRDLNEPVSCTLRVHHSYSRTVLYRVFDSVRAFCERAPLANDLSSAGRILTFRRPAPTPSGRSQCP